MTRNVCLLALLISSTTLKLADAQQTRSLPAVIQPWIDDNTIVVIRADLTRPETSAVCKRLSEMPDPSTLFGRRAIEGDQAIQSLIKLNVRELFTVISTSDLTVGTATLIVPSEASESQRLAIVDALKTVWPGNIRTTSNAVVVESTESLKMPRKKPTTRSDLATAFAASKYDQVQFAAGLGPDARRVLREFVRTLPAECGGGSIESIAGGFQWLSLGMTLGAKPNLRLQIKAKDVASTDAIKQAYNATLNSVIESELVRKVLGNPKQLIGLLTPSTKEDSLFVNVAEANGGSTQLMDAIATPLVAEFEKNSLRMNTRNHLKEVILALHNFHDANKAFPARSIRSKEGTELLSWRVQILPYLGEGALYSEFHLDEPWDSEHNRKLIPRMPAVFISGNVTRDQRAKGMTTIVGLVAAKTFFGTPDPITIQQITDGTSNAIAVVDANSDRAVPWTKPADLDVDLKQPQKGLVGQEDGVICVAFCDGSVRSISDKLKLETFRRLIQINDGEPIDEPY